MKKPPWNIPVVFVYFWLSLGYVLDDEEIVDILRKTKITSSEISKRIDAAEKAESEIQATRKNYLPIATRGALLYFLVAGLTQLDHMYQFSLDWFQRVFVASVVSRREKQERTLERERASWKKVPEMAARWQEPKSTCEKGLFEEHLEHSIDALTRNVFEVRRCLMWIWQMRSVYPCWSQLPFPPLGGVFSSI